MAARALGNKAARTYGRRNSFLVGSIAKKGGKRARPRVRGVDCLYHGDVEALCVGARKALGSWTTGTDTASR